LGFTEPTDSPAALHPEAVRACAYGDGDRDVAVSACAYGDNNRSEGKAGPSTSERALYPEAVSACTYGDGDRDVAVSVYAYSDNDLDVDAYGDDDFADALADLRFRQDDVSAGDASAPTGNHAPHGIPPAAAVAVPPEVVQLADSLASLHHGTAGPRLPLGELYESLRGCASFDDVLTKARAFTRVNPMVRAGEAAVVWAQSSPHELISLQRIADDARIMRERGVAALLADKYLALAPTSVQPDLVLEPDVPCEHGAAHMNPRPTADVMAAIRGLADGAPLLRLPETPPAAFYNTRKSRGSACDLAIQRLAGEDHRANMLVVLPFDEGVAAFAQAGLPLRLSDVHIAPKSSSDGISAKGRLVTDYSASGLNSKAKKAPLAATYGAIKGALPSLSDFCQLALSSIELFPGEPIVVSKSDNATWYKKVRSRPQNCGEFAWVMHIDGVPHLAVPTVNQFGSQDSGYQSLGLSAVIANNDRYDATRLYSRPVSGMFSDDNTAFLPWRLVHPHRALHENRVREVVGPEPLNPDKNVDAEVNDVIGFTFDMPRRTVAHACHRYLKMVNVLFHELPVTLTAGDHVPVSALERAASYMMQASALSMVGRTACHAVYRNISNVPDGRRTVALSEASLADVNAWRAILLYAFTDARCLTAPLSLPPLVRRNRDETWRDFAHRQADHASIVINSDSAGRGWATPNTFGCGFTARARRPGRGLVPVLWGSWEVPYVPEYVPYRTSTRVDPDNNFYEFVSAVVALDSLLNVLDRLRAYGLVDPAPAGDPAAPAARPLPTHMHVWTDNTPARWWLAKNKANSPLHAYVLQVLECLQVRHAVVVAWGHVKGEDNGWGDAPSRGFLGTPGVLMLQCLWSVERTPRLPRWFDSMRTAARNSSSTTWADVAKLLTTVV